MVNSFARADYVLEKQALSDTGKQWKAKHKKTKERQLPTMNTKMTKKQKARKEFMRV